MKKLLLLLWCLWAVGCSQIITSTRVDTTQEEVRPGIPYYLPKSMFSLNLDISDKIVEKLTFNQKNEVIGKEQILEYQASLKLEQQTIPDPDHVYLLEHHPNIFYNDNIQSQFTDQGFLKSLFSADTGKNDENKEEVPPNKQLAGTIETTFSTSISPNNMTPDEKALANRLREDLKILKGKQSFAFAPEERKKEILLKNPLASGQFKIVFDLNKLPLKSQNFSQPNTGETEKDPYEWSKGVKFRIPEPYRIDVRLLYQDTSGEFVQLSQLETLALLPDESPIFTLPIQRYSLVKASISSEFKNGLLSRSKFEKESFILKFLSLPKELTDLVIEIIEAVSAATKSQAGAVIGF